MSDTEPTDTDGTGTRRELFKLLQKIDPTAVPTFRGKTISRAGLEALARECLAADEESKAVLGALYEDDVIPRVARDEERAELLAMDEQWHANMKLLPVLQQDLGSLVDLSETDSVATLRAEVLLAVLDDSTATGFIEAAPEFDDPALAELGEEARGALERVLTGGELIRSIVGAKALCTLTDRYEVEKREAEELVAKEELRSRAGRESALLEHRRRGRRSDTVAAAIFLVPIVTVYPAALVGNALSRTSLFSDSGTSLLRRLGAPFPVANVAFWGAGSIVLALAGALAAATRLLVARRRLRAHTIAIASMTVFATSAAVLAFLLPGFRGTVWSNAVASAAHEGHAGPCARWNGASYAGSHGSAPPVIVGPAPHCQLVTRIGHAHGQVIWQHWVRKIHVYRIHKVATVLLVGGTYNGRRTTDGSLVGGTLIVAALAQRNGREMWRRSCPSPSDGEHAIAFGATGVHHRGHEFVRLRCGTGAALRINALTGRLLHA